MRRVAIPLIGANFAAGSILAFVFAMLEVSDSLILAQQAPEKSESLVTSTKRRDLA